MCGYTLREGLAGSEWPRSPRLTSHSRSRSLRLQHPMLPDRGHGGVARRHIIFALCACFLSRDVDGLAVGAVGTLPRCGTAIASASRSKAATMLEAFGAGGGALTSHVVRCACTLPPAASRDPP